ncbi:MAG TPA: tetratricopeptide repeat protein, partial [Chthoniobacteraceae bacterium]|nr:tetratricopeptide repeat protein [Chthoniobacteraceae bacterium]
SYRTRRLPPNSPAGGIVLDHCPSGRVPEGLGAIAMKALRVDPADRYQSVEEMQADITAFQGGFATKAEKASAWRQMVLFGARHKREVALLIIFTVVLQALSIAFAIQTNFEKNRAIANENKVTEGQVELAKLVEELRGTAPVYAQEAASLLEEQKPEEALEKVDYALAQVPNQAEYHFLRANILQTLLRFNEAAAAYEEVLKRNPRHKLANENLQLTRKLMAKLEDDGQLTPADLRGLHSALVNQKRVGEALYVLGQIGRDKKLFFETWKAAFEKRGFRHRFESRDDQTLNVDLSKTPSPDLNKLRGMPVSGLNLDDSRTNDISALKGLPLETLSLNRCQVGDLSPLVGMPLRSLQLDGAPATTITALARLPLENLRLSAMRIESIDALRGMKLEQLNLSGCRRVQDISALEGMPLQSLDLSRTGVSDLSVLVNSPIRELNLDGCVDVTDLGPLMEIKTLESVLIPSHCKDIAFLRDHPNLKRLSYKKLTEPAYEFWANYDARRRSRSR